MSWAQKQKGFTVVELLIVVVVIAILAAIILVAYNGIQDQARRNSLQTSLTNVARALETRKAQASDSRYPSTLPTDIALTNGTYEYTAATDDYCLTQVDGSVRYFLTSRYKKPVLGTCVGLLGWWPLNGSVNDQMRGVSSTNVNGASGTGQNGQPNTGWLQVGNTTARFIQTDLYFSPQSFTASIWMNYDGGGPSSFSSIMSNARDCCATYTGFQIDFNRTTLNLLGRLWMGGGGPASSIMIPASVTVGQWQHIALTYDGTNFRLYLNGQLGASSTYTYSTTPGQSLVPMKIGGMGSTSSGHTVGGTLDDARIYSRALSADEIAQMYVFGAQ